MRVVPRRSKDRAKVPGDAQATEPRAEAGQAQPEPAPAPAKAKSRRRGGHRRRAQAPPGPPPSGSEPPPPNATQPLPTGAPPATAEATQPEPTTPLATPPTEPKPRDARSAERARRAAALRRTQEQRRARARSLQAEDDVRPRSSLLAMIITMGVLIAAVAVTGALIATSRQNKPVALAAPLHVYPVTQVVPGACPAGTQGITGQQLGGGGPSCYQLSSGIAIRKVADLRVQGGAGGTHDVAISLLSADRRAFADLTRGSVGRPVAFVVRDQLVTAPRVDMPITGGKIVVTGRFTRPDADRLVRTLKGT